MVFPDEQNHYPTLASKILERYPLCDWCLGRQFPNWLLRMKNAERGSLLRSRVRSKLYRTEPSEECYICRGLMPSVDHISDMIVKSLIDYEFKTFLVGASLPSSIQDREDEIRARFKLRGGESVKGEINQTVGRIISSRLSKRVRYHKPDLTVITNPIKGEVTVRTRPTYLLARYIKKARELPQKQSKCQVCLGSGCDQCKGSGMAITPSVENILAQKLLSYFQGGHIKFTWVGGEDANSLVMGNGRPFYAEILDPKVRHLDPARLISKRAMSGVALTRIRQLYSKPSRVPDFSVTVVARVRFDVDIDRSKLKELEKAFTETSIESLSRRKNKILVKNVNRLSVLRSGSRQAELKIECDGGISIRELVTGTRGDVKPNFSGILGIPMLLDERRPFDILSVKLKKDDDFKSGSDTIEELDQ